MVFQLPIEMISDVVGELEDAKKGGNKPKKKKKRGQKGAINMPLYQNLHLRARGI